MNKVGSILFPTTKPLKDLAINTNYLVKGAATVATRFGARIKIVLEHEDEEFETFMPPRICKFLFDNLDIYNGIQEASGNIFLRCAEPSKVQFIDISNSS